MAAKRKRGGGLSAAFCGAVKEPGRYTDAKGLMLIVAASGSKRWGQRLVIQGKRCDLGLGGFPRVSLSEARELAEANQKIARAGGDPRAEKRSQNENPTFERVMQDALEVKQASLRNKKHAAQWRSTLEAHALPAFGWKRVQDIEPDDVVAAVKPIWKSRTVTATRVRERIEYVLDFAAARSYRKGENPARWKGNLEFHLPAPRTVSKQGHHPALQLEHVGTWFALLKKRHGMAARALEFLTLTAARSGEVRGAVWSEFDMDKGIWTIPSERMKARREHRVPLTSEAIALLEGLPRLESSPYIFFAPRGGMLSDMSVSAVMRRIQATETHDGADGFVDRVSGRAAVPHGIRSSFRQWTAECGYDRDMAEMALAHRVGSEVERAYQRSDMLDRRRGMMEAWAAFLADSRDEFAPGLAKDFLLRKSRLRSVG